MCDPVSISVLAVTAAATTASAIQQNQQVQHAKGAAQAQEQQAKDAANTQVKIGPPQTAPAVVDPSAGGQSATKKRQQALAAGMMSTFGPNGNPPAPPSLVSAPQAFASGMKQRLGE